MSRFSSIRRNVRTRKLLIFFGACDAVVEDSDPCELKGYKALLYRLDQQVCRRNVKRSPGSRPAAAQTQKASNLLIN